MNERLKLLRKVLSLSQEDFSKKIGVTRSAISRLESGDINFTEQMIKAICREFNVDYLWLTTGEGETFVNLPETIIDELALEYDLDNEEKALVKDFVNLSKEQRSMLMKFFRGK